MTAQLRLFCCQSNFVTKTITWVVASRTYIRCCTVSSRDSSLYTDARKPEYYGCFKLHSIKSLSQQTLTDFKLPSILMCLSICLVFNKAMDTNLHYRCLHCSKESFENKTFQCYNDHVLGSFCVRNSNPMQYKTLRTILSNYTHIRILETQTIFKMDTRNISSKAGKIAIGKRESWEMFVDHEKLTPLERKIHERHRNAVRVR